MFITPAYAQAAGAPSGNEMFMQLIPFILIFIIMAPLIQVWRPIQFMK